MFTSRHIVCDEDALVIREGKEEEKIYKKKGAVKKQLINSTNVRLLTWNRFSQGKMK